MNVMNRGCEADDHSVIDRHSDVMPNIGKELLRECSVDRVIEHLRSDLRYNVFISALEDPDFDRYSVRLSGFYLAAAVQTYFLRAVFGVVLFTDNSPVRWPVATGEKAI